MQFLSLFPSHPALSLSLFFAVTEFSRKIGQINIVFVCTRKSLFSFFCDNIFLWNKLILFISFSRNQHARSSSMQRFTLLRDFIPYFPTCHSYHLSSSIMYRAKVRKNSKSEFIIQLLQLFVFIPGCHL